MIEYRKLYFPTDDNLLGVFTFVRYEGGCAFKTVFREVEEAYLLGETTVKLIYRKDGRRLSTFINKWDEVHDHDTSNNDNPPTAERIDND